MPDVVSKIPIVFEGMMARAKESTDLANSITQGFTKLLVKVGVLAALWDAFSVFLRPIMSMLKLIMVLLFMPLMPLIKQMLLNMKTVADKVRTAQEKAGGEGMGAFGAGTIAMLTEPSVWALIGIIMAGAFVGSLLKDAGMTILASSFGKTVIAAIIAGLTLKLFWDTVMNEGSLMNKLSGAFGVGMGAAIFSVLIGAASAAVTVGLVSALVTLGLSFFVKAVTSDDWLVALANAGLTGVVATGLALLLGASAPISVVVGIGAMIFTVLAKLAWNWATQEEIDKLINDINVNVGAKTISTSVPLFESMSKQAPLVTSGLKSLSNQIGGPKDSLLTNLTNSGNEWTNMKNISVNATTDIVNAINKIPTDIWTIHHIKTVYE